ncbi:MAG: hypothetical protein B7Z08_09860 [Sphingomonadales bacterium 32-68-7]|nr:MAG: hypothetical protein B7Z33_00245 [Sphingomonadales bacterium 12-68-11]OYX08360.1 MAG: hypothetical protein B7Z08_09860 [Sphingomonadales bacterium 32-68-7]
MKLSIPAILAAALLSGCTTAYSSTVEVTRFVGEAPAALGRGSIEVRLGATEAAAPAFAPGSFEAPAFRTAVAQELQRLGYQVVDGGGDQVAELWLDRAVDRPGPQRSPVSVGVGGSTGSYGSGVGLGVGINLGGSGPREVIDRQLRVVIRPAAGGQALWEGRARFDATGNSDFADPQAAADRLARALFGDFPGRSGETVEVE